MKMINKTPLARVLGTLANPEVLDLDTKQLTKDFNRSGYTWPLYTVDLIRAHDFGEMAGGNEDGWMMGAIRQGLSSVWLAPFPEEDREALVRLFDEHVANVGCCGSHLGQTYVEFRNRDRLEFLPKELRKQLKTLEKIIQKARMPFFDGNARDGRTGARLYPDPLYRPDPLYCAEGVPGEGRPSTGKFMRLVTQIGMPQVGLPEVVDTNRQPLGIEEAKHGRQAYAALTYAPYQGRGKYRKEYGVNAYLHYLMLKDPVGQWEAESAAAAPETAPAAVEPLAEAAQALDRAFQALKRRNDAREPLAEAA